MIITAIKKMEAQIKEYEGKIALLQDLRDAQDEDLDALAEWNRENPDDSSHVIAERIGNFECARFALQDALNEIKKVYKVSGNV